MEHSVNTRWQDRMAFDSHIGKHTVRIDTSGEYGDDTGAGPKQLLLSALAGCTGMDVVSLLKKMRIPFTGLEIDITADLTDTHPKVYSQIRLVYRVFGHELEQDKVKKAIDLSQEKYCGVSAMLRKNSPILYDIEYVN